MFGFNTGRNKVDSYSKEEIDSFLKDINKDVTIAQSLKEKVYIKDDYAIIEGSITLISNTSENLERVLTTHTNIQINYPTEFDMNNCICLGILLKNNGGDRWSAMSLDSTSFASRGLVGSVPRTVTFYNNYIQLSVGNPYTQEITIPYKIILLKYK